MSETREVLIKLKARLDVAKILPDAERKRELRQVMIELGDQVDLIRVKAVQNKLDPLESMLAKILFQIFDHTVVPIVEKATGGPLL